MGTYLVEELIQNMGYSSVKVFSRRKLDIEHIKVIEHIVDVENITSYTDLIRGDDIFICLGTTMKKAGTIARYEELDRDMPVNIASEAYKKGVKRIAVISAQGANSGSRNYYYRIKGEMEEAILELGFTTTIIARPSLLLGERKEFRLLERAGITMYRIFSFLLVGRLRYYRAIHGRDVANAMIDLMARNPERSIFLSSELQEIADLKRNNNKEE